MIFHVPYIQNPMKRILPDITAPGIVMAAMSLSEKDCNKNCDDHADVFLNAGTYPFVFVFVSSPWC